MKIVSQNSRSSVWHLLALFTIVFWGTSFVSTKVLLGYDFSAVQIFTFRFVVTYLILLLACHQKFRCENFKHELILFVCGITGCTLYFWTENTALTLSSSSNVSLIVCTNPLLIMIFGGIIYGFVSIPVLEILWKLEKQERCRANKPLHNWCTHNWRFLHNF